MITQWSHGQIVPYSQSSAAAIAQASASSAAGLPPLAWFTWMNQGTATAVQTTPGGPLLLTIPDNSSLNWRLLSQAAPVTPYKLNAQIRMVRPFSYNSQAAGVYFSDGTKLFGFEFLSQGASGSEVVGPVMRKSDNVNGLNSATSSQRSFALETLPSLNPYQHSVWIQLRNDGATLFLDWSADGSNFTNFYSEAVGSYITPSAVAFGGLSITSQAGEFLAVSLLAWTFAANASL